MKVEVLLVANAAAVENGLLSVAGGGWENYTPGLFPSTLVGSAAGIMTLDDSELDSTPAARIEVSDADGQVDTFHASMIISGIRPATTPGVPVRFPFEVRFTTVVRAATVVNVGVYEGDAELATVTFAVSDPVPDTPAGA